MTIAEASNGSYLIVVGFCLRFAEEFEVNLDDWKPENNDQPVMNACVVEKGTYKVCSKTTHKSSEGNKAFQIKEFNHLTLDGKSCYILEDAGSRVFSPDIFKQWQRDAP